MVYILLGYFALTTAGESAGPTGVLEQIEDAPAGTLLLALVGIGLAGYGIFRLYGSAVDLQGQGSSGKGIAMRIGHASSGFAHLFLAWFAFKTVFFSGGDGGGEGQSGEAASAVAQLPGGELLLVIVGIGFLLAAANQGYKAYGARFMVLLDADAPRAAEYLGRAGYAARAVVFLILGWQILSAVLDNSEAQMRGISGVLTALRDAEMLYTLVAVGLILFGAFSLVMARYRKIRNDDVIARLKQKAGI